jgi:DNA-binding MarR family transcriptional regulator
VTRPTLDALIPEESRGNRVVRDAAIREAFAKHGYKLKEIGDHVGLHYATVSRIIKQGDR